MNVTTKWWARLKGSSSAAVRGGLWPNLAGLSPELGPVPGADPESIEPRVLQTVSKS